MSNIIFSKNTVEFVTVGVEFCSFVERISSLSKRDFVDTGVKLLPLLYLKAVLLPQEEAGDVDDEPVEKFVTEEVYEYVRQAVGSLLGEQDTYLEVFHSDMQYSDAPIAVGISEDIADIYQDVKDFVSIYSLGNEETMLPALIECQQNFATYWGQKLVNSLRALHQLRYSPDLDLDEEKPVTDGDEEDGNWLFERQRDSWNEEWNEDDRDKWNE